MNETIASLRRYARAYHAELYYDFSPSMALEVANLIERLQSELTAYKSTDLTPSEIKSLLSYGECGESIIGHCNMSGIVADLKSENTRLKAEVEKYEIKFIDMDTDIDRLKWEIDRLKAERDKAVWLSVKLMKIFAIPQRDYDKYLRRLKIGAGDYMGTGYAIMDAFYRIYDDFCENASDELYGEIKKGLGESE